MFISYAREDEARAVEVADALRREGLAVWRDNELGLHREYEAQIRENLVEARWVILLWSENAAKSSWVRGEASVARKQNKLIRARLDDTELPLGYEDFLFADLRAWRGEADHPEWRRVVAALAIKPKEPPHEEEVSPKPNNGEDEKYLEECRSRLILCLRSWKDLTNQICQELGCRPAPDPEARIAELADRLITDPKSGLKAVRAAFNHFERERAADVFGPSGIPVIIRTLVPLVFGPVEVAEMRSRVRAGSALMLEVGAAYPPFVEGAMARLHVREGRWVKVEGDYPWGAMALDKPPEEGPRSFDRLPDRIIEELSRIFIIRSDRHDTPQDKLETLNNRMRIDSKRSKGRYYYVLDDDVAPTDQNAYDQIVDEMGRILTAVVFVKRKDRRARKKVEDDLIWGLADYLYDQ